MQYNFYYSDDQNIRSGAIKGSDLRIIVLDVARRCSDVLDECEGALAPDVIIERGRDGAFNATIDTHGLGDLYVRLENTA